MSISESQGGELGGDTANSRPLLWLDKVYRTCLQNSRSPGTATAACQPARSLVSEVLLTACVDGASCLKLSYGYKLLLC